MDPSSRRGIRTGCWSAICGRLDVETVEECHEEVRRGSAETIPGYVPVSPDDLARRGRVHPVDDTVRARLKLAHPDADGMDAGEQDLVAYALASSTEDSAICSPDKASVRAAVKSPKLYWRDSGLVHALLGVRDLRTLLEQSWVGASWEAYVIEQLLGHLLARGRAFEPYHLGTSDEHEVDLVL